MKIKKIRNVSLKNCAVLCDTQEKSDAIVDYFRHKPIDYFQYKPNGKSIILYDNPWLLHKENTCYFLGTEDIVVMSKDAVKSIMCMLKNFEEIFEIEDETVSKTETTEEAYKRGLNDMYAAIQTVYLKGVKMTTDDYAKCFGDEVSFKALLLNHSAEEIINILNDYFESKTKIEPYDEVFCEDEYQWLPYDNTGDYGVVLRVVNDIYTVLLKKGILVEVKKERLRKTGRTISITNILDSISAK